MYKRQALNQAYENAKLNHLENKMRFIKDDVFDYLDKCKVGQYDIIVLDPPAFTKSRRTIDHAYNCLLYTSLLFHLTFIILSLVHIYFNLF